MEENKYIIPVSIIIAGALIAWGIYANPGSTEKNTNPDVVVDPMAQNAGPSLENVDFKDSDHILGDPKAKIRMITFNDLECPYCDIFHQSMEQIIDEYAKDGQVAWTIRQFPVHGEPTKIKAAATECAALLKDENAFWEMTTEIFKPAESGGWVAAETVYAIATDLGFNEEDFKACMENPEILAKIDSDYQDAISAGATGTPYTIVITEKGERFPINGAQPYESVKDTIEMILGDL